MKNIVECPVCNGTSFNKFLETKDYFLTKEKFNIVTCKTCDFHFTNPIPNEEHIEDYYKSENYVSHNANKKGIINFLYNWVRKRTLRDKAMLVRHETEGKDLLDFGSGSGHFLSVAENYGFNGVGIEPSKEARDFAIHTKGVKSSEPSVFYDFPKHSFDVITLWHVLEHVMDLEKDIQQMHQILKFDGKLIVAVPNMNSFDARHYKKYWAAYDLPRHLYHFQEKDIARLMLKYNFQLKKVIPMKYDAYYISMLSEKYRSRLMPFGIFIGLLSNLKAKKYGYSSQIYVFEKS